MPSGMSGLDQTITKVEIVGCCTECGAFEGVEYFPADSTPPNRQLLCFTCLIPALRAELYSQGIFPTCKPFDFHEFAKCIYEETAEVHQQSFFLPALYGGEASERFEVLFVLEAPSVSFTEYRWSPCSTTAIAIQNHRAIFFDWAYSGKQAHLFRLFDPAPSTSAEFFRRFYVTDIWKDAEFKMRRGDREYKAYWISKLQIELQKVPARRIIFFGNEALRGERFVRNGVNAGVPIHHIRLPSYITEEEFKGHVTRLAEDMRTGRAQYGA